MNTAVLVGPFLLIALVSLYLYALTLPAARTATPTPRRDVRACACLVALSYTAAAFLFQPKMEPHWLALLIWAVLPGTTAATAGRRPFLYLLVSSVCAGIAAVVYGSNTTAGTMLHIVPLLGFVLVTIIVNVLGTFLLLPLLAVWEYRRRQSRQLS